MARTMDDSSGGGAHQNITHIEGQAGGDIALPAADFVTNADIARDGQDLVLTAPDGSVIVIDGYFLAEPAPLINAPDGTTLTPQLVESFSQGAGPTQLASAEIMSDVSPVGAVREVHGSATVTHPDGSSENITLGTAIYQGDVIETQGDGAIEINFIDESSFAVSSNARLAIDEYVFDPASQGGESNFSMLRGMFVYTSGLIGREDPDDVTIDTPVGSIGIRGTTIAGNVDTGEITVIEGAIVLHSTTGDSLTMADQFSTGKLMPDGEIIQMESLSGDDLGTKFMSMNSVAPAFFATISDAEPEQTDDTGADTGEGILPEGEEALATDAEPTTDSSTTDATTENLDGTDGAIDATLEPTSEPAEEPVDDTIDDTIDDTVNDIADPVSEPLQIDSSTTFDGPTDSFSGEDTTFADTTSSTGTTSTDTTTTDTGTGSTTTTNTTAAGTTTTNTTTETTPPPPSVTNIAPVISNGGAVFGVAENSILSTLVGSVTASDPDATGTLSYSIVGGNTGGAFSIDSTGAIHVAGTVDFETSPTFNLTVRVSDGTDFTDAAFTVNLTDVNDAPVMAGQTFNVNENSTAATAVGSIVATDQDLNGLTFTETGGGTGAGLFDVDAAGNVTVTAGGTLDFETTPSYTYEVQVDDGVGGITTTMMTINVNDLDDTAPTLPTNTGMTVTEGDVTTVITSAMLTASDIDTADTGIIFTLTTAPANGTLKLSGGALSAANTFTMQDILDGLVTYDHGGGEIASDSFNFDVDDGTNTGPTAQTFSITVTPVNDAPTLGTDTFAVDENSAGAAAVGTIATAADVDGGALTFTETGNGTGAGLFDIDAAGNITVTASGTLDFENVSSYSYEVTVNDGAGGTATTMMTININDITGEAITGTTGNDTLLGDTGNDTFFVNGSDGSDTITGGTGTDTYDASAATGNITITLGTPGNGTAVHGADTDTFTGIESILTSTTGSDTFIITDINTFLDFDAGAGGVDMVDFSALLAANFLTIDLGTGAASINGGSTGSALNFENAKGTLGKDILTGSAGINIIWGMDGNDTIDGGAGADTLNGGVGDDTFIITDGDGNDTIDGGGAGTDVYDASAATNAMTFDLVGGTVTNGADTDSVTNIESFIGGTSTADILDLSAAVAGVSVDLSTNQVIDNGAGAAFAVSGIEEITGSAFNDILDGDSGNNTIWGGVGDDDIADDFGGNDSLYGEAGNDILAGGAGDDLLDGGAGTDTADYFTGATTGITVDLTIGGAQLISTDFGNDTLTSIEKINATNFNDTLTGSATTILLEGLGGADTFNMAVDTTVMDGGAGLDTLEFAGAATYNLNNTNLIGIETINADDATAQIINLGVKQALFTNDTSDITVNLDNLDALDLDFTAYDGVGTWNLTAGDMTTAIGTTTFTNDTSGYTITINKNAVGATVTETGAGGGAGAALDLNTLATADGFAITDDISEGFGGSVASLGDKNGDGFDDIGIVKELDANAGSAFILNGQSAAITSGTVGTLTTPDGLAFTSSAANYMSIAGINDFNGDGIADYIVGAPFENDPTAATGGTGQIHIIDGSNGSILVSLTGLGVGDLTGESVSGIGDINDDGYADVIIGAPASDNSGTDAGSAYILYGDAYTAATVLDVATLEQPQHESSTALGGSGVAVETSFTTAGNTAFTLLNNNTIKMFDMDDPAAPVAVGSVIHDTFVTGLGATNTPMDNGVADIIVNGPYMYILTGNNGLTQGQITVLDISDPTTPTYINEFTSGLIFNATSMDMDEGGQLVVTTDNGGTTGDFLWLDVSVNGDILGAHGAALSSNATLASAQDVVIAGDYAYVATGTAGDTIQVVDMTGASSAIGSTITFANAQALHVNESGNLLFAISDSDGGGNGVIQIYDLSTPNNPPSIGTISDSAIIGATDITVDHGIAYVTTTSGVIMFDVSNPASITPLGNIDSGVTGDDEAAAITVGEDGTLYITSGGATNNITTYDIDPVGNTIDGGAAGDLLGTDVAAAGDFNNDGFDDFIVSNPGAGSVSMYFGGHDFDPNAADLTFTGISVDASNEIPLFYMGDMNGDGISDIAIAHTGGTGQVDFFFGGSTPNSVADFSITPDAGFEIISGGATGDFNGDGFDDAVIVMRDTTGAGDQVHMYVVYGGASLPASMTTADLNNANNAYHITYTIPAGMDPTAFDVEISSAGDLSGDGYYDLLIGMPNVDNNAGVDGDGDLTNDNDNDGTAFVVYGRDTGISNGGAIIQAAPNATAGTASDILIGTDTANILDDGAQNNISFSAGAGNDTISLSNGNFDNIDGGGGTDILDVTGSIDFRGRGSEDISRIEGIDMSGTNETLILSGNILSGMMQDMDGNTFTISESGNSNLLLLEDNGPDMKGAHVIRTVEDFMKGGDIDSFTYDGTLDGTGVVDYDIGGKTFSIDETFFGNGTFVVGHNFVTDNDANDSDAAVGGVAANANGQTLVGTSGGGAETLFDNGFVDVSLIGLDGDDTLQIFSDSFATIDGGTSTTGDTLQFTGVDALLDLRGFGSGQINDIEAILLDDTSTGGADGGQTLILSMANIFELMNSSETGVLSILSNGDPDNKLQIDNMNGSVDALLCSNTTSLTAALDLADDGLANSTVTEVDANTIDFGGAGQLFIDSNLLTADVVVI